MSPRSPSRSSPVRASCCLLGALLLGGCGGSPVVSGKVSYKNKPLTTGEVSFISADGKSRSGLIGSDGKYEVRDAPAGPVTIVVVATKAEGGTSQGSAVKGTVTGPDQPVVVRSLVPEKYSDPKTSGLSYTVGRGRQTKNLDLED